MCRHDFEQLLESAFINTRKVHRVEMPWEKGVAKQVLGKEPWLPKPLQGLASTWVGLAPDAVDAQQDDVDTFDTDVANGPFYPKALMAISDTSFQEQMDDQLNMAVEKWLSILRLHPVPLRIASQGPGGLSQRPWG